MLEVMLTFLRSSHLLTPYIIKYLECNIQLSQLTGHLVSRLVSYALLTFSIRVWKYTSLSKYRGICKRCTTVSGCVENCVEIIKTHYGALTEYYIKLTKEMMFQFYFIMQLFNMFCVLFADLYLLSVNGIIIIQTMNVSSHWQQLQLLKIVRKWYKKRI